MHQNDAENTAGNFRWKIDAAAKLVTAEFLWRTVAGVLDGKSWQRFNSLC